MFCLNQLWESWKYLSYKKVIIKTIKFGEHRQSIARLFRNNYKISVSNGPWENINLGGRIVWNKGCRLGRFAFPTVDFLRVSS